jgi:hypothetical protein
MPLTKLLNFGPVTRKDDLTAVLDVANGLLEAQGGAKW